MNVTVCMYVLCMVCRYVLIVFLKMGDDQTYPKFVDFGIFRASPILRNTYYLIPVCNVSLCDVCTSSSVVHMQVNV